MTNLLNISNICFIEKYIKQLIFGFYLENYYSIGFKFFIFSTLLDDNIIVLCFMFKFYFLLYKQGILFNVGVVGPVWQFNN